MKILVIGSSGQLAQSLAMLGRASAHIVTTLGRPDFDATDTDELTKTIINHYPDIVVNAAAYTAVDQAETDEAAAFSLNATAPKHMAISCEKIGVPLIHISTDYVFDGDTNKAYQENDATIPATAYGRTKLQGEHWVASHCKSHLILRTSWVYSPFGKNFLKTMLNLANSRTTLGIVSDQIGNPTYAPHLAQAILAICNQLTIDRTPKNIWGIYHLAGSNHTNWFEFANEIFHQASKFGHPSPKLNKILSHAYPTPAKRPMYSALNSAKAKADFDIKLPHWQSGVEQCIKHIFDPDNHTDQANKDHQ